MTFLNPDPYTLTLANTHAHPKSSSNKRGYIYIYTLTPVGIFYARGGTPVPHALTAALARRVGRL